MLLLVFAALGFAAGYWLGIARRGFVSLGAVSIATSVLQVVHLLITKDRTMMTLLPLVVGTVVVTGMLLGALLRTTIRPSDAA
jgi:hypothetical protein